MQFSLSTGWKLCARKSTRRAGGHTPSPSPTTANQGVAWFEEVRMSKLQYIAKAITVGAIVLLVTTTLSAAQNAEPTLKPTPRVAAQKQVVTKPAKPAAAQANRPSTVALAAG